MTLQTKEAPYVAFIQVTHRNGEIESHGILSAPSIDTDFIGDKALKHFDALSVKVFDQKLEFKGFYFKGWNEVAV